MFVTWYRWNIDAAVRLCSIKCRTSRSSWLAVQILVAFVLRDHDNWRGNDRSFSGGHDVRVHVRPTSKDNFRIHHHLAKIVSRSADHSGFTHIHDMSLCRHRQPIDDDLRSGVQLSRPLRPSTRLSAIRHSRSTLLPLFSLPSRQRYWCQDTFAQRRSWQRSEDLQDEGW